MLSLAQKLLSGRFVWFSSPWEIITEVIIGPISEEMFFRGAVLSTLMRRRGPEVANLITSLLFVGAHIPGWYFQGSLSSMFFRSSGGALSIFLLGLVFGFVALKSRSVLGSILTHCISNLCNG